MSPVNHRAHFLLNTSKSAVYIHVLMYIRFSPFLVSRVSAFCNPLYLSPLFPLHYSKKIITLAY